MDTVFLDGHEFVVVDDRTYRCQCGTYLKKKYTIDNIKKHLATKSHKDNVETRRKYGNVVIFTSVLKPLKVCRA